MQYTPKQYPAAIQAYAFAALVLFLVALVIGGLNPLLWVIAAINIVVLIAYRLK